MAATLEPGNTPTMTEPQNTSTMIEAGSIPSNVATDGTPKNSRKRSRSVGNEDAALKLLAGVGKKSQKMSKELKQRIKKFVKGPRQELKVNKLFSFLRQI